jgi:hypothetical protein
MKAASSAPDSPTYPSVAGGTTPQATSVRPSAGASCSPRASVAYSFLFVVEWFGNKLHSFLRGRARQTVEKQGKFPPKIRKGKFRHHQCALVLLFSFLLIDKGGLALTTRTSLFHDISAAFRLRSNLEVYAQQFAELSVMRAFHRRALSPRLCSPDHLARTRSNSARKTKKDISC